VIPLVAIDASKIAPFQPYGLCCAIAFFAWDYVGMRFAVRRGFDRPDFRVLSVVIGVFGWFFAWAINACFYGAEPSSGGRFTVQGLSSTGAIVGATLGAILWSRFQLVREGRWRIVKRAPPLALLPISEVILATWPVAFAFGRLGCALIHDHVGKRVSPGTIGSLFAVGFPRGESDGVHRVFGPFLVVTGGSEVRYDLGLIELVVLSLLAVGFALTWHREVKMGTYTIVSALVYGPARFVLDFLRAEDGPSAEIRYGGLTFAQYWSLAVIALGVVLLVRRHRFARAPEVASSRAPV
jgi:phosphatidylglycerol:prolipoprotein diacylglycerol transferase